MRRFYFPTQKGNSQTHSVWSEVKLFIEKKFDFSTWKMASLEKQKNICQKSQFSCGNLQIRLINLFESETLPWRGCVFSRKTKTRAIYFAPALFRLLGKPYVWWVHWSVREVVIINKCSLFSNAVSFRSNFLFKVK